MTSHLPSSRYRLVVNESSELSFYRDCERCDTHFVGMLTQDICGACLLGDWNHHEQGFWNTWI